ncbi:SDR family NAD(P)-dependent oxidoreductase, partial [Streptomyces sp. NPDC002588]|uniref:SDR family NAD(P)-dependent oxidoreductase n=1 Tax=Streptomyces sp. NPDC002588 TaxID=3154419 RepID=UPI00332B3E5B
AAETVAASHPGLNVLVNNAGIMLRENLLDPAALPVAEDHVTVNLLGTIRMTYAFLPLLIGKADAAVMNVTSALAFVPMPGTPTYNATKAALHSFSESLRVQLAGAGAGVQVIEVAPPGVRTTLLGQQDSERSMPLDDFLTETLDLLREQPDAKELVVERARFVRDAEANGSYDQVLAMLSGV